MNERINGLLAYLDRLITLEDTTYNCHREITECIQAARYELGLVPLKESGITLQKGDEMTVIFTDRSESLLVIGPAKVTVDEVVGAKLSEEPRKFTARIRSHKTDEVIAELPGELCVEGGVQR
ncbi:hypothetical protein [Sporosarcina sp. SAFN-015]|uniref:hypothetical protein n=1 Tax=Sporosarcina sp. SAFN-015 TaxID=3387274 RepID=UPI003F803D86